MILSVEQRRYGLDATLIGIGEWLNRHRVLFDDYFETYALDAIRFIEEMTEPHPTIEDAMTNPSLRILGVRSGGQVFGGRVDDSVYASRILLDFKPQGEALLKAVGARGCHIRNSCVLDERPFHEETYALEIWRDGVVLGVVRYWDMVQYHRTDREDALEQFFVWTRNGEGYVESSIELRLWNTRAGELSREAREAFRHHPAGLLDRADVRDLESDTYQAAYMMKRQPSRISFGRHAYSLFFVGHNPDVPAFPSSKEGI
jgi:hypothetical protein